MRHSFDDHDCSHSLSITYLTGLFLWGLNVGENNYTATCFRPHQVHICDKMFWPTKVNATRPFVVFPFKMSRHLLPIWTSITITATARGSAKYIAFALFLRHTDGCAWTVLTLFCWLPSCLCSQSITLFYKCQWCYQIWPFIAMPLVKLRLLASGWRLRLCDNSFLHELMKRRKPTWIF